MKPGRYKLGFDTGPVQSLLISVKETKPEKAKIVYVEGSSLAIDTYKGKCLYVDSLQLGREPMFHDEANKPLRLMHSITSKEVILGT